MKKKFGAGLVSGLLIWGMAGAANASLLGDVVSLSHEPAAGGGWSHGGTPTVTDDAADSDIFYQGFPFAYRVNVDASSIQVDYAYLYDPAGTWGGPSFNGLIVSDLNDSSGTPLQNVLVSTNMAGWTDAGRLSWTADSVAFDWQGLSFNGGTFFDATLTFGNGAHATPEPATLLLLGSGLAGVIGARRQKRAQA